MTATEIQNLYSEQCYHCYGVSDTQALELALLARWSAAEDSTADRTAQGLLDQAACANCYTGADIAGLMELGLLAQLAGLGNGDVLTDWSQRVVANGGAMPSQNTIIAMETFRLGMISAGLDTKIISLCVFVPDSVIAATTPLIFTKGFDPWTNHNFVAGDLTVHGLKGNGTTKYLDTGVQASSGNAFNSVTGNCGLTTIVTEANANVECFEIGHRDAALRTLILGVSAFAELIAGRSTFFSRDSTAVLNTPFATDWNRCGYISGNNVTSTANIYVKTPLTSHILLATAPGSVITLPSLSATTIYGFAFNDNGAASLLSSKRLSVLAIHDGWTQAESATFAGLLQTLRTSLGGGTGDEAENWAMRVQTLGGAAPSAATISALSTFVAGLNTDSILTKMISVNAIVPDNFTAALVPIIWRGGLEIWTNNNFIAGDLTVSGLQGNGTTKYLDTGLIATTQEAITPVQVAFSSITAGQSAMISVSPATANGHCFGVASIVPNSLFGLRNLAGTGGYFCWGFGNANDFASGAVGATTGYISGNRTSASAIALYRARSNLAHATVASAAGAQTGAAIVNSLVAFALNSTGVFTNFNDQTVSFLAIHSGLTSAESALFYARIATLRTALGGGSP